MSHHARSVFVFLLLLIPSAQFAWQSRDMPQFASLHDDGLFFLSAQSLARGHGYRIPSLPENPDQTKFPPLYPLYLSIAWRINPAFPANLALGSFGSWMALAACLALAWRLYRSDGLSEKRTWILVALLGLSPYMILFGSTMFSPPGCSGNVSEAVRLSLRSRCCRLSPAGCCGRTPTGCQAPIPP